jgi:hypothetical protein
MNRNIYTMTSVQLNGLSVEQVVSDLKAEFGDVLADEIIGEVAARVWHGDNFEEALGDLVEEVRGE